MKFDIKTLSERQIFNMIKNGGVDIDQFFEWCEQAAINAVERHERMKEFYENESE